MGNTDLSGRANPGDSGDTIDTLHLNGSITVGTVPEPAVLAQLLALIGMGLFFHRRKQQAS